jgi:SPP1 family predicted phage head-tail adaptor
MQGGTLDRRITLMHRVLTSNRFGEQVVGYETYDQVWAQKLDVTGREFFSAQRTLAEGTTRFRIRHRNDLLATDLITYGGREYDIIQIAELGRKDGIEILATVRLP